MVPLWWSIALTVIGVGGLFLVMRRHPSGPIVGLLVQFLWVAYAIATRQWGFLGSAFAYGAVNAYGINRWLSERGSDASNT